MTLASFASSLAALAVVALAAPAPAGQLVRLPEATAVAVGAGSVWATAPREVVRISPGRGSIVAQVGLPALAGSLTVAGRLVWVVTNPPHTSSSTVLAPALLYSIDTTTNRVVGKPIPLAPMAQGHVVAAAGSLWVTNDQHGRFGRLYRVDPLTRRLVQRIPVADDPSSIVFTAGSLWVGAADTGKVTRIDPTSGRVEGRAIAVGGALLTLAADGGRVWAADTYSGRLVAIDVRTAQVVAAYRLAGVTAIAAADGTVWATIAGSGRLVGLDEATGRRTTAVQVKGGASALDADGRYVWIVNRAGITRVG